jgi:flagellar biosynthesis repressor protein FlbT
MALKVELKPGERVIIGDAVITNSDQRTRFLIEGDSPILREKDILTAKTADTPAKRIYLAVQLMYTAKDSSTHHGVYFQLLGDFLKAAPSSMAIIQDINNYILTGEMYKALKTAKKLIAYETELLENAKRGSTSVRVRRPENRKSP